MSQPFNGLAGPFEVRCSAGTLQALKGFQERALEDGRGEEFLTALRALQDRLRLDPLNFGEPLYRLPALKLSIRVGGIPPLMVSFGVHESRPLVLIQFVKWSPTSE